MAEELVGDSEEAHICNADGYCPTNRSGWCDLGCGSDYNQMYHVSRGAIRVLLAQFVREALRVSETSGPGASPEEVLETSAENILSGEANYWQRSRKAAPRAS